MEGYVYVVEVLYEQIYNFTNENGEPDKGIRLAVQSYTFQDDNENKARNVAQKEMDRIIRYGMTLRGGAIVKSIILPSAIKQIGLVDLNKFEEERKKIEENIGSVADNIKAAQAQAEAAEELLDSKPSKKRSQSSKPTASEAQSTSNVSL